MISAFDVYLVMQLDSIKDGFLGLATFGLIGGVASALGYVMTSPSYSDSEEAAHKACAKAIKICASVFVAFSLTATFIPSTKTMAAMIVLPALTSDEVVQPARKEAAELYDLAKQALRRAVEAPPTPEKEVTDEQ